MANTIKTIFDSGNKIAIDVSNIQRIDGAGLQLLCVLVKEANEKDIAIAWKGESQSFRDAVSKCGLTDILRFVTN
jgi:anti-anti-sigma regulatory factor